eukprot:superscaffoldBa00002434_g14227
MKFFGPDVQNLQWRIVHGAKATNRAHLDPDLGIFSVECDRAAEALAFVICSDLRSVSPSDSSNSISIHTDQQSPGVFILAASGDSWQLNARTVKTINSLKAEVGVLFAAAAAMVGL